MDMETFKRIMQDVPDSAFDGHTEFDKLTVEQKLAWLSEGAQFIVAARSARFVKNDSRSPGVPGGKEE